MSDIDRSILSETDDTKHLEFIQRQYLSHPVVKIHHPRWKELIEWENGDQFSEWDDIANKMVAVKLNRRKKRVVINLMKPLAEAIEGKINFISTFQGVPNSSELNDIEGAKVATRLLAHSDYTNDVEYLNEEIKYWLIRTGNAVRRWTWDKSQFGWIKGEKENKKDGGELIGCVPSIFNIRPDPTATTIEQCRWFIEYQEVTQDAILENFPEVTQEALEAAGDPSPAEKHRGMYVKEKEVDKEELTYIVAWYWEKKSSKFLNGRLILSIPGLVLWAKENPALGRIPFFKYGYKRYGDSFWYTGPLYHVQDIQRDFNRMISIISEHVEGWRAKMIVPQGSILKEGAFTTDSFELLEVDLTKGEPKPLQMPELSAQVLNHRDFLLAAKDLVSNVHEVSYSQLPQYAQRAPASLYSMMLEQENLKIDPMIKAINHALKLEAKFRLEMMDEYYEKERLVKIVGKNERTLVDYFKGSDLHGNFDVKLIIGVNIHQSKTIQQRMMLDLKAAGAPIEWDTIMKLIWEGDISQEIRASYADKERASREDQAFLNGTWNKPFEKGGVQVLFHDDHEVHLNSHSNTGKTEEAQRWDDETWDGYNQHIFKHMAIMAYILQQGKEAAQPDAVQTILGGATGGGTQPKPAQPAMEPAVGDSTQVMEDALPL